MVEIIIVGGGIVGLAITRELLRRNPNRKVMLLEKESSLAKHQTGHNSGVIHAGIYYKPGSLKARLSVEGHAEMLRFCDEHGIPYRKRGKVIVALNASEVPRLHDLYERGKANGVKDLELISRERLHEIEPYMHGIQAIWSPHTGVVDYAAVAKAYAEEVQQCGGEILTNTWVEGIFSHSNMTVVRTTRGDFTAKTVITSAGLYSDRISGEHDNVRIVPFRGSYYTLSRRTESLVNGLIYPVPDPRFPFLGVHFTRTVNDDVLVGPNAVLAFSRQGYQRWRVNPSDVVDVLTYNGFWRLARKYWRTGSEEMYRDLVKEAYLKTVKAYIPEIQANDLKAGPSGVRAQALRANGNMVDDFLIKQENGVTHVLNAPSPAATSSMPIARYVVDQIGLA